MSTQVGTAYVNQFSANVRMLAQQMTARLRATVDGETLNGEFGFFDQIGAVDPVERVTRHADTPITEVPHSRRRLAARDWEMSDIIDAQDVNRMLASPQGRYTKAFASGMARKIDKTILDGFFLDAATGKAGGTTVTFPTAQQVAVDYVESGSVINSSLTLGKLRRARELLMDAEAGDELYIACSQRELNALLRTTEVGSAEFNGVKALVNGEIDQFMGFSFIRVPATQLSVDASSNRRIPAYSKTGLIFAAMEEPVTKAAEDPTKGFNIRVYMRASFGAVRMEEKRVVEIKCHPTTL